MVYLVEYDNCYATFESDLSGTILQQNLKLKIYPNRESVAPISTVPNNVSTLKFYADWLNGEGSPAILEIFNPTIQYGLIDTICLDFDIRYNAVDIMNIFDRVVSEVDGIEYIYKINDYDLIRTFSSLLFEVRNPDSIFSTSFFDSLISVPANSKLEYSQSVSHNRDRINCYITGFENIDLASIPNFPILINSGLFQIELIGTIQTVPAPIVNIQYGRIGDKFPKHSKTMDIVGDIPLPVTPPQPTQDFFQLVFQGFTLEDSNFVSAERIITPEIALSKFQSITSYIKEVFPNPSAARTRTYTSFETDFIYFNPMVEGRTYELYGVLRTTDGKQYRSPSYIYKLLGGVLILDLESIAEKQLEQTKIFLDEIKNNYLRVALVNSLFNSDLVVQVKGTIKQGDTSRDVIVQNTGEDSQILLEFDELTQLTTYEIEFYAITVTDEIKMPMITLETLKTITAQSTVAEKQENAHMTIIKTNYDLDIVKLIEVLPDSEQSMIVCNSLLQNNDPAADQRVHDFNEKNKKGSVFNTGDSESVKANYKKNINALVADAVLLIDDIDEGYRI